MSAIEPCAGNANRERSLAISTRYAGHIAMPPLLAITGMALA